MMSYDPPDFPYKELTDTLKDIHSDELIFDNTNALTNDINILLDGKLTSDEFSNDPNIQVWDEAVLAANPEIGSTIADILVIPTENLLTYEPVLLDENTVNQFLLPPLGTAGENKENTNTDGTDLLALQSCVLCHEIFTNETDLLDHTILAHVSEPSNEIEVDTQAPPQIRSLEDNNVALSAGSTSRLNENEWLICCLCERVLSTALEIEPAEQLCCTDEDGKGRVSRRFLQTMYVCDFCSGLFADGDALDRHKDTCAEINATALLDAESGSTEINVPETIAFPEVCFTCGNCGLQFPNTGDLKVHSSSCSPIETTIHEKRPYIRGSSGKMWNCGSCNQLFATARELYRHKRGEDRPADAPLTAYVCEECDKVLGSMCALHTHRKMHKNIKPGYPCRICGRRFNQSGHLAIHMRMHTGERPYPCDLCPKAFKVKVERDDHRRTHTGERPFACSACPKTFTAAARLREHARIHTDQRPYKCEICGAAFRRPYARTVHTLIHTGEKPHECDICKTAFRRSGDMWKHKRTIHGSQLGVD